MVRWWSDWETFRSLPYGGSDVMEQPQFVVQILRTCIETNLEVDRKADEEAKREAERRRLAMEREARRRR